MYERLVKRTIVKPLIVWIAQTAFLSVSGRRNHYYAKEI